MDYRNIPIPGFSFWVALLLTGIFSASARAQLIAPCSLVDCGEYNANFTADGAVAFCEGETITLRNTSDDGFEFFLIDWQDGTIDTVYDKSPVSHVYRNITDDPCAPPVEFRVRFQGLVYCDNGYSCASGGYDFALIPDPTSAISAAEEACVNSPVFFTENACNEDVTSYEWNFGDGTTSNERNPQHTYQTPGDYTVRLTVNGKSPCQSRTDVATHEIRIVDQPDAVFVTDDEDNVICAGDEITFTDQSNEFTNIRWSISPARGWAFTDTLMNSQSEVITIRFGDEGDYRVDLTGANTCTTLFTGVDVSVQTAPVITLRDAEPACGSITVTPADLGFAVTGAYSGVCWSFITPDGIQEICEEDFGSYTFTASGRVEVTVESDCGSLTSDAEVVVQSPAGPVIIAPAEICSGSAPDTLTADVAGGRWAGDGIIDEVLGIFDPAAAQAGGNEVTYSLEDGPCTNVATVTIEVVPSATVTASDVELCISDSIVVLRAEPVSGTWSGAGITNESTGAFSPAEVGPGLHRPIYTYVDDNGCSVTASPSVRVSELPVVTVVDSAVACLVDEPLELEQVTRAAADSSGGSYDWFIDGVPYAGGTFNPVRDLVDPGTYGISYTYTDAPCTVSGAAVLQVIDNPVLALEPVPDLCISEETYRLETNLGGGIWSGPGIDSVSGLINLRTAGGGPREYRYVFQPQGSCEQTATVTINIEDPGAEVSAGTDDLVCEGTLTDYQLSGAAPAGGTWSGPGLTGSTVDLTLLRPDSTYLYRYTISSSSAANCSAEATKRVTYSPRPDPGFTLTGGTCVGESFTLQPLTEAASYEWDFGDGTTSTLPNPEHDYAAGGRDYTLSFALTSAAGCRADTQQIIRVVTAPVPAFSLDSLVGCAPFTLRLDDRTTGEDFSSRWLINGDTILGGVTASYVLEGFVRDTTLNVILEASNGCGTRVEEEAVTVKPRPQVDFGFALDDGCSPFQPRLSNATTGNPDYYLWDLGNGNSSSDSLPALEPYTTSADRVTTYPFQLIAGNECGTDTLVQQLTVYPPDVEAFISLDNLSGCQPWSFRPRSISTPGSALAWSVTDPEGREVASDSSSRPEFILNEPGLHRVILRAARCGADADTAFVEVLPAPELTLNVPARVCVDEPFDLAVDYDGLGGGEWSLGDGRSSTQVTPRVSYDSAGTYQLLFIGRSELDACPAQAQATVEVLALPAIDPVASDSSGCLPFSTRFSTTPPGSTTLMYDWNFRDGSSNSSEPSPTHTFNGSGTFSPQLTVTDGNGCVNSAVVSLIRVLSPPTSGFRIVSDRLCAGADSLRLVDESTGATSYQWTVAGEVFTTVLPPSLPLRAAGEFTVSQRVTNAAGCSDSVSNVVVVLPTPDISPTTSFPDHCLGTDITLNAGATGASLVSWELGDGSGAVGQQVSHRYARAGSYPLTITASNDNGCPSAVLREELTVHPTPTAGFRSSRDEACGVPATVSFVNESVGGLSYLWDFGDGGTATAPDPQNVFRAAGEYTVSLVTTSAFSCRDTALRSVSVSGAPIAAFPAPPVAACAPYQLSVAAGPTDARRFEWYVNDDLLPRVGSRLDTLLGTPGAYDLRLIAIYDDICRDTLDLSSAIRLEATPEADFVAYPDESPNLLGDVRFENLSSGGTDYFWDLGDGTTRNDFEFTHEYRINRDVEVLLRTSNTYFGGVVCSDTIVRQVAPEWLTRFFVPTAISPQSGPPEVRQWGAKGVGVSAYQLEVISPFGQRVFSTDELTEGQPSGRWDGRLTGGGDYVLQGAYTWRARVTYVNGVTENLLGTVTVLR